MNFSSNMDTWTGVIVVQWSKDTMATKEDVVRFVQNRYNFTPSNVIMHSENWAEALPTLAFFKEHVR